MGKRMAENDAQKQPKRVQAEATLSMLSAHLRRDVFRLLATAVGRVFDDHDWKIDKKEVGEPFIQETKWVGAHESCVWSADDCQVVEVRDTRHVAHAYDCVADAMWRTSMAPFAESDCLFESLEWGDDLVVFKHRGEATPRGVDGHLLTAVLVMKKFVEEDRTVVVWRSTTTTTKLMRGAEGVESPFSDEEGWNIVERVPAGVPEYEAGTCIVRRVERMRNVWHQEPARETPALAFDELIVRSTKEDVSAIIDAMQKLLTDAGC